MYADLILNGKIFTGFDDKPRFGAVIICGNKIQDVTGKDDWHGWEGPSTDVVSFGDELIMPAFHDFHTHTYAGGISVCSASLYSAHSEEEAAKTVAEFAAENPDDEWVLGLGWYHVFWDRQVLPTKKSLDRLIPNRPVFLFNAEYHGAWVNSKALEVCGITRDTPDPEFGKIERDEVGEPTGFLYEDALGLAASKALDFPEEKRNSIFRGLQQETASHGITAMNDMMPLPGIELDDIQTYKRFEQNGELDLRIYLEAALNGKLERARELRNTHKNGFVRFSGLKAFLDGVATTYTASVVDPYSDKPDSFGLTLLPPEIIRKWVVDADAEGFRVRLHACGDGGVRLGLDCYEAAKKANGSRDSRHAIEHIETLHPDDFPRFKELGVMASIQPEHLAMTEKYADSPYLVRFRGEREKRMFTNNSFIKNGVKTAYSSDFPVVDMNPMHGIHRAVTRVHNDGQPVGGWNPKEKTSLADALKCYTSGSAYGAFRENELGKIAPGMIADLAILMKDPFELEDLGLIREIKTRMTILDGKKIFAD